MNAEIRTCTHVWGGFKPNLSLGERVFLRETLKDSFSADLTVEAVEGVNFLLFSVTSQEASALDPALVGGSSVLCLWGDQEPEAKSQVFFPDTAVAHLNDFERGWGAVLINDAVPQLVLGRDRSGTQAVYYGEFGGVVVFATDLRLLRRLGCSIDNRSVHDFLHFLYIPAPRTIYREIRAVVPGEIVCPEGGGGRPGVHALPASCESDVDAAAPAEFGVAVDEYARLLVDALERNVAKQGKTALLLSGGKDSSTLAIGCKLAGLTGEVEAVTVGFGSAELDEADDARTVARHLGMKLRVLRFSGEEYRHLWLEMVRALGQPMGDFAVLPVFAALKSLKRTFSVYWDGTGTDQPFGILANREEELAWRVGQGVPFLRYLPWRFVPQGVSYKLDCVRKVLGQPRQEQFVSWNGFDAGELKALTGERCDFSNSRLYAVYENCTSASQLKTQTVSGIWQSETATRKLVQVAGGFGVAARYPFKDRKLESFSVGLPDVWKSMGGRNKVVMRELMSRHLPKEIVAKTKGAFNFPKEDILEANNFRLVRDALAPEVIRCHGIVDDHVATRYVMRYMEGDRRLEDRIWALLMLHTWLEVRSS